jgi:hypothetical protein
MRDWSAFARGDHFPCSAHHRSQPGVWSLLWKSGIAIHLKGGSDKCIHGVLSCQLAENTIGAEAAVASGEEYVRASTDVFIHSHFAPEGVHTLDPTAFDGRNQRWMGVESPVFADLPAQPQRLSVGWEQELMAAVSKPMPWFND